MYVALDGRGTLVRPNDEVPVSVRMMSADQQWKLNSLTIEPQRYTHRCFGTSHPFSTIASRA